LEGADGVAIVAVIFAEQYRKREVVEVEDEFEVVEQTLMYVVGFVAVAAFVEGVAVALVVGAEARVAVVDQAVSSEAVLVAVAVEVVVVAVAVNVNVLMAD